MKRIWILAILLPFLGMACATEVESVIYIPDEDVQYYHRDMGDCIADCKTAFKSNTDTYEGYKGGLYNEIDNKCHEIKPGLFSGDVDYIGIGSPLFKGGDDIEIVVNPAPYSKITPVITVRNHYGETMMVSFNRPGYREARASLRLPITDDYLYVAVEELSNYELGYKDQCNKLKGLTGGEKYGFIATVRHLPKGVVGENFKALKVPEGGQKVEKYHKGELLNFGEVHYYFFEAHKEAKLTIWVKSSVEADSKMNAILSGLKLSDGSLEWLRIGNMQKKDSNVLTEEELISKPIPGTDMAQYGFIVFDFNGRGGTEFKYDLTVKVE